jgi:hypothetical protein
VSSWLCELSHGAALSVPLWMMNQTQTVPTGSSRFFNLFFPSLPDCHSWPQQQFFNMYQLNRNGPAWWHKEEEANCIHIGQRSHRSSSPARSFLARTHNNLASTSKSVYYYYLRLERRDPCCSSLRTFISVKLRVHWSRPHVLCSCIAQQCKYHLQL